MEAIIISGKSKKDIKLLATIAEKMGLSVKIFDEDSILGSMTEKGKTEELIDTAEFLLSINN